METPVQDVRFYQAGLTEIDRRLSANPDNPDVYFKKAIYLQALGRTDEALTAVKQAIALDVTPDYLMKEAELLVMNQDYTTALTRISRAQILGGDYPDLWHLMAELNYLEGNYEVALSEVGQALHKFPAGTNYFCTKGKIEWALHDTLVAFDSFNKSVGHPETNYESLLYLEIISRAKGEYDKAFEFLERNLSSNPRDRVLLKEKGKLLMETAQYDSALVIYHILIDQDTTDYVPLYESALVHYQIRRYDSTLYYTDKSLLLNKQHLPSMLTQARVYDRRRYYGTAIKKYQEIITIDSTYLPAVDELAKLIGKIAYLQKIQKDREENAQVETITPTKPPVRN